MDQPKPKNQLANKILNQVLGAIGSISQHKIRVIGIDGPTAVGKTIFAQSLKRELEARGHSTWVYQLDWTLAARNERTSDLEHLKKTDESFVHEAELHMLLPKAQSFLTGVRAFNERLQQDRELTEQVKLEGLYSRDDDGREVGKATCLLKAGLIILVEGHYTLRTELDQLIDYNILMLAEKGELLDRKIARVKGYRSATAAEDYFHKIDEPSFSHHLVRFFQNADLVIENTNYFDPSLLPTTESLSWIGPNAGGGRKEEKLTSVEAICEHAFGRSLRVPDGLRKSVNLTLEALIQWDIEVGQRFRFSVTDVSESLSSQIDSWVAEANSKIEKPFRLAVGHTNAFHNVYFRHLPISLGLSIYDGDEIAVGLLADILDGSFRISIVWPGGVHSYSLSRDIGAFEVKPEFDVITRDWQNLVGQPLSVLTPTDMMLPPFLDGRKYNLIVSGREDENVSASEAFLRVLSTGGVWVHRFALFEELNFFLWLVERCGMSGVKAGNYLIAIFDTHDHSRESIKEFVAKWRPELHEASALISDEKKLDFKANEGRSAVDEFVREYCPNFLCLDNYLFCPSFSQGSHNNTAVMDELRLMLRSDNRLLRKRAFGFIQQKKPDLRIDVSALWPDLQGSDQRVSLQTISKISPSILAEIYLWLSIREEPSAVLGANVYDIGENSLDGRAYLEQSALRRTPVVLQCSLNAIGQKELGGDSESWGYLKPEKGVETFVDSAMRSVRDVILAHDDLTVLFAIGLDHIDFRNDTPTGRAGRFTKEAVETELVTHFVLDGSALFKADNQLPETLDKTFKDVLHFAAGLLPDDMSPIMDFEFCFGELNYFKNASQPMLPNHSEMVQVARICREILREAGFGAINARPKLFIGNLGTTHHGEDSDEIQSHLARTWVDATCRHGFVSAVLHGTTASDAGVLSDATDGCYKVNVAGDLLDTLISNLPADLQARIHENHPGAEAKRGLHLVRQDIGQLDGPLRKKIREKLANHCGRLMDTIRTPRLTKADLDYFQYCLFKFADRQIDCILEEFSKSQTASATFNPLELTAPDVKHAFSASMIEVPFGPEFEEITQVLWEEGIDNFHVDVGDGKLIPRRINALDKVAHLRSAFPASRLHAHFMVKNPHLVMGGEPSFIEAYAKAGCDSIAVHEGAFNNRREFEASINAIRELGVRPGLLIETNREMSTSLFHTIRDLKIDWVVVMGVPIGFGGQIFDSGTFGRMASLRNFALSEKFTLLIEVDGGLTADNLSQCLINGSQLFAGWSIIRGNNTDELRMKIRHINAIIARTTEQSSHGD